VSILNITIILIQYVFQWDSSFGRASCGDEHHFRHGVFPCCVYTSLHSLAIVEQCRSGRLLHSRSTGKLAISLSEVKIEESNTTAP
jgi:hypothetical protein